MNAVRRVCAARVLGASGALGEYPPAYASWANTVKQLNHGAVVTWPASLVPTANAGKPAARYTSAAYIALPRAVKSGDTAATRTADRNGNVYVLAPSDVLAIKNLDAQLSAAGSVNNPKETTIYEQSLWQKLGLPDVSGPVKAIAIVAVVGAGIGLAIKFLPRGARAGGRQRAAA